MNFLFKLVFSVIMLLIVAIIITFIHFGFERRSNLNKQQKVHAYLNKYQTTWYSYLVDQVPIKSPINLKHPAELEAIERILFSYSRNFSDASIHLQISNFANEYLKEVYGKMLRSRRWSKRMNALYRIDTFAITQLLPEVEKMMKKPQSKEEYLRLLAIYSNYFPDQFFSEFFKAQERFTEYEFKQLFSLMNVKVRKRMSDSFDELSTAGQYAFIELLGKMREFHSLIFLHSLLENEESEIRIRTLKAIHEINMLIEVERILPFVDSPIWQERMLAARLFGEVPLDRVKDIYFKLIEDSSWWVRTEAARVLSLTKAGKLLLVEVIENSSDKYAVDVSIEFLLRED